MPESSTPSWPFTDPKNVLCITTSDVINQLLPITYVGHDADDGCWQFIASSGPDMNKAMVVGLSEICDIDPTIYELADLPLGWCAERKAKDDPWVRSKCQEENSL